MSYKNKVKVIYIVPKDVKPWPEARSRAQECLEDLQWFFADQMDKRGYGPKTFKIATDNRRELIFQQIEINFTKDEFQKSRVNNCKSVGKTYGLRNTDNVVVYFYESYSIRNGKISGQGAKGQRGEAFLSILHLKMAKREWIANNNGYVGEVFNWISLEPMKVDTLSWNRRGTELGDVAGSAYGIIAHELGHSFGLSHNKINDKNRRGYLMNNGCRGMRGYFRPDLTNDFCVLSERNAANLNKNNFFGVRDLKPKSIIFY